MSYWIEKLIVPLVLMVIGGIGTVAWQYVTSPEATLLSGRVKWVSVPNPLRAVDARSFGEIEKAVAGAFGQKTSALAPFQFDREIRVAVITILNLSNVRSKEIEIITKQDSILYSAQVPTAAKGLTKKIVIPSIDPLDSATVYGVIGGWPYSVTENLSAVYDNKRLPILGEDSTQEFGGALATIVSQIPFISSALMFVGLLSLFIIVVSIPFQLVGSFIPRLRVKWTNEYQLKNMLDIIELAQKEDPAKLEKARALQKDKVKIEEVKS